MSINDLAYSASPKNTAGGSHQVRDDGFHSRPVRGAAERRRKVAIAVASLVLIIATIFVMRATGDRDQRVQPVSCIDLYDADICELLENP